MTETERLLLNALEEQQKEHERTVARLESVLRTSSDVAAECTKQYLALQQEMRTLGDECAELRKLLAYIVEMSKTVTK